MLYTGQTLCWPDDMATSARRKPPPPTLVLLIRHGMTPSTGAVLPGRAPGLHLAEAGLAQARSVAERLAAWSGQAGDNSGNGPGLRGRVVRGRSAVRDGASRDAITRDDPTRDGARRDGSGTTAARRGKIEVAAVYASPLERTRETAMPIAAALGLRVKTERGLLECDFGEWTGAELKSLFKLPEWTTVQRYPSGFRFPGGESFAAMQARAVATVGRISEAHRGKTVVAVSHADPIKAVVADALGTHLDLFQRIVVSPCSVTAISYGPSGPSVLAVNSTGTLSELMPS